MPTQILAVGTTAPTNSSDVVVTTPVTIALKDASGPDLTYGVKVDVLIKDDGGQYFRLTSLTRSKPAIIITGPGTYRFTRMTTVSCGVFSG